MSYSDKLRDPRWQKKRLLVMERDGFECRNCGAEDKTLNVHHKVYRRGRNPWDYPDYELTTLCEHCHEKLEDKLTLLRLSVQEEGSMVSLDEVLGFIDGRWAHALYGVKKDRIRNQAYSLTSPEHFSGFLAGFITAQLVGSHHPVWSRLRRCAMDLRGCIPLTHFLGIVVKDTKLKKEKS